MQNRQYKLKDLKDYKSLLKDIALIPNFSSEYKVSQIHKFMNQEVLNTEKTLESIYVLLAISVVPQDLYLYEKNRNDLDERTLQKISII